MSQCNSDDGWVVMIHDKVLEETSLLSFTLSSAQNESIIYHVSYVWYPMYGMDVMARSDRPSQLTRTDVDEWEEPFEWKIESEPSQFSSLISPMRIQAGGWICRRCQSPRTRCARTH